MPTSVRPKGFLRSALVGLVAWGGLASQTLAAAPDLAAKAAQAVAEVRANEPLVRELAGMGAVDQLLRARYLALMSTAAPGEVAHLREVWRREYQPVDAQHVDRLKALIPGRGWFSRREVGDQAADAAFLILQHSGDLPLMKAVAVKMEALAATGDVRPDQYALLYDRIAVLESRPQRYGTQLTDCRDGRFVRPADIEDPSGLDLRRAAVGLPAMDVYMAAVQRAPASCNAKPELR